MKIIDCFIFFNEVDLLLYRLELLHNIVDKFVLVESEYTFTGKKKESFFKNNIEKFSKFLDKIIYINLQELPYLNPKINIDFNIGEQWKNEFYQRDSIKMGLDKIELYDDDIIIISDVDEIINPIFLNKIKNKEINIYISSIKMDFYYYNLKCKCMNQWILSKIFNYEAYKNINKSISDIRKINDLPEILDGGWHLSYFGDENFIKNKIKNFSHQEFNNNNVINNISTRIKNSEDLFGRINFNKISVIDINKNDNLPPKYNIYLKKFI